MIFSAMVSEFGSPPKEPPKKVRVACQGFGLRAWQLMVGCGESEYRQEMQCRFSPIHGLQDQGNFTILGCRYRS